MSIRVLSENPQSLLQAIKDAIDDGDIVTWNYDADGDFTHSPPQWKYQAWLRPKVDEARLIFNILAPKNTAMNKAVYAVYHGRFAEMLLTHFDLKLSEIRISALPWGDDRVDTTK